MKKKNYYLIILFIVTALIIVVNRMDKKEDSPVLENTTIEENKTVENKWATVSTFKEENLERYEKYEINNSNMSLSEIVKNVNLSLDYDFYKNITNALNEQTKLVLTNKYYKLSSDYVPNNLVNINIKYATNYEIKADEDAVNHFEEMCESASNIGLRIKAISAYRSYDHQNGLYSNYLKQDPQEVVDTYSARPGHSEHQTGYAFDVYNTIKAYTDFGDTEEFKWVKDNAHFYGFIIRYTKENEYITGYKNEPWHLRYVGVDAATTIYEKNITLEEYLLN